MKWQSHRIIGISAAVLIGGGVVGVILSYIGSTLPDIIEGKTPQEGAWFFKSRMRSWSKSHRGSSHWAGWYITLALAGYHIYPVFMWLGIGSLTHLLADALTPMGVPVYPFSKKKMVTLNLFATGSVTEVIFTSGMLISIIYYVVHHPDALHIL